MKKTYSNKTGVFDFESLELYQKALEYIDFVFELTKKFPKEEMFGLTSQFRRAADSIALNLGEGYGETFGLFFRYMKIAAGSTRECVVCTTLAYRRKYITETEKNKSREKLVELSKMSSGLKKYVRKKEAEANQRVK